MNREQKIAFFQHQLQIHLRLCFKPEASPLWKKIPVLYLPWKEACLTRGHYLVIPIDQEAPLKPQTPWRVPFGDTNLTLWNPLPAPQGAGWNTWPSLETSLWYCHETGTIIPAWNLFSNLLDLLTLREERELLVRDKHGRFPSTASPRYRAGLLQVPAFNEAVAALLGAGIGMAAGGLPQLDVTDWLLPPVIALSHDCDILLGNDLITQLIRFYRCWSPLFRGKLPSLRQLAWIGLNSLWPQKYYFHNLEGMVDVERQYGFRSIFYLLNGQGGRFGARSGTEIIRAASQIIPPGWEVGIHYNYDTYLEPSRFNQQFRDLQNLTGQEMLGGRSHYLRFDPERSFHFLASQGMKFDESVGYPDFSGYRAGISGIYAPLKSIGDPAFLELPLIFMDSTLAEEEMEQAGNAFFRLLDHLEKIGGVMSVLFHPGNFHNPEFPELLGLYIRILDEAYRRGCRCFTPKELIEFNAVNNPEK